MLTGIPAVLVAVATILRCAALLFTLHLSWSGGGHFSHTNILIEEFYLADTAEVFGLVFLVDCSLGLVVVEWLRWI